MNWIQKKSSKEKFRLLNHWKHLKFVTSQQFTWVLVYRFTYLPERLISTHKFSCRLKRMLSISVSGKLLFCARVAWLSSFIKSIGRDKRARKRRYFKKYSTLLCSYFTESEYHIWLKIYPNIKIICFVTSIKWM